MASFTFGAGRGSPPLLNSFFVNPDTVATVNNDRARERVGERKEATFHGSHFGVTSFFFILSFFGMFIASW